MQWLPYISSKMIAALPLGEGRVLDPFMGAGSTIAAAEYIGYTSVGVELDE
jgi:site-specific DNA-methyltransferase (adenine-specific)